MPTDARPLKIRQAAKLLGVCYNTIRGAIEKGDLRAYRYGPRKGAIRIEPEDLQAYKESCVINRVSSRPSKTKSRRPTGAFKRLNADRMFEAWREQGELPEPAERINGVTS